MACWEASQRPREPSLLLGKPGLPILRSGGASKVSRQSSESQDVHTEYLSQSNLSHGWLRSAVNVHRQVHQQEQAPVAKVLNSELEEGEVPEVELKDAEQKVKEFINGPPDKEEV